MLKKHEQLNKGISLVGLTRKVNAPLRLQQNDVIII